MSIYLKNNPAKFYPDEKRRFNTNNKNNNKNNNNNEMIIDKGSKIIAIHAENS